MEECNISPDTEPQPPAAEQGTVAKTLSEEGSYISDVIGQLGFRTTPDSLLLFTHAYKLFMEDLIRSAFSVNVNKRTSEISSSDVHTLSAADVHTLSAADDRFLFLSDSFLRLPG